MVIISNNIARIIYKQYQSQLTTEEQQVLNAWRDEDTDHEQLYRQLQDPHFMAKQLEEWNLVDIDKGWEKFKALYPVTQPEAPVIKKEFGIRRFFLAASLFLCLAAGTYFTFIHTRSAKQVVLANSNLPVLPGKDQAILTIGNGEKILLDDVQDGKIVQQENLTISKQHGQIVYKAAASGNTDPALITYNTLSTPRGGQFRVLLPDGTNVMLNAASSITYPTSFTGNKREVSITGEAYFEVAKSVAKPFIVKVNNSMEVQVHGTHFNVNAYSDEPTIKTTLEEGSISLKAADAFVKLIPGQQASLMNTTASHPSIDIRACDVEAALAWKNGFFHFSSNLQEAMRQIARWYNVDIAYEGAIAGKDIAGSLPRSASIKEVVEMLNYTGTATYQLSGRKITVRP